MSSNCNCEAIRYALGEAKPEHKIEGHEPDCVATNNLVEVQITPVAKRYAHFGKRRRSITEELFRCQFTDMISRTPLVCNHLLWRNRPDQLREHLKEHMKVEDVAKLSNTEISEKYAAAKRIFLEGIPEDDSELDEEDYG